MIEMFEKAGMFTTTSKRNLKTGITFIRKFLDETYNNLDQTTQKRLDKKTNTFNISYVDKYTAEKLERDINNKTKYAVIDRELFNDICNELSKVSDEWEWIVSNLLVPKCDYLGYCPEKNTCGRKEKKEW